ncbi:GNAT family N-acetyltransferase [Clostridium sp. 1001271B_151109_B4]|uniref:GNAT family N-acetyltransferase n=1 Tax=Clostridium sp. 1001271B_151109_B4 TaxID=2787148 RepID=UPI0018AA0D9B|nr:GNAT family N-acetyltransferase [Clostridium sp. 1001271B_151109_B4]
MECKISIRNIGIEEVPIAQEFLFKMIRKLFNYDIDPMYHNDIINMQEFYINEKRNTIIGAFDRENNLVGTIAVKPFIDRFDVIKGRYKQDTTAEIGRCYINQDLRRQGVGTLLFDSIVQFCKENGYEDIYLHTHRHLPGGFDFWIKKGFFIIVEEDNEEKTVHMVKGI